MNMFISEQYPPVATQYCTFPEGSLIVTYIKNTIKTDGNYTDIHARARLYCVGVVYKFTNVHCDNVLTGL